QSVSVIAFSLLLTHLTATTCLADDSGESRPRPNIVVILVDDMGFSDIGCYGSEIPTPNLDALAANGLKFRQFYNTGRCCPTRASLLTGLYSHQAGIGHMTDDYGVPGYRGVLNRRCVTLGDVARSAGYFTAATGKWHVGHRNESNMPLQRGFDRFFGVPEGGGFYFQVKAGRTVRLNNDVFYSTEKPAPDGWYSTDAWTEYSLKFVDEAKHAQKPFLLYLAHNAPHFPLQATADDIAMFRGRYKDGWDKLSKDRLHRQLNSGLIDSSWEPAERSKPVAEWDSLSDQDKDRFDHLMATYAACVYRMDRSIGTLVEGLKQRDQFDNTLILFMSDNGGCAESGPRGRSEGDPTVADSNWFCGESWAWMQDTPFRKFKHYNHEGGIATPLIAHWPAGIQSRGEWRDTPAHLIDVMATVVDLTGATYPEEHGGVKIQPAEGRSLRPVFDHQSIQRDALYWEHEGNAAIREGDWKLVRLGGKGAWELYNMKSDRTEQHNLAETHPDRVRTLEQKWLAWAERCHVHTDGLPDRSQSNGGKKAPGKKGKRKAKSID
ncbi:MAG: arylsulfatase, partial [Planctomycetaceae bacterium]|nr:arylsulfatase [Planctomycetaceae bacterium]